MPRPVLDTGEQPLNDRRPLPVLPAGPAAGAALPLHRRRLRRHRGADRAPLHAEARWLDSLRGTAPYEPVRLLLETEQLVCDEEDLPFDDRLSEVTVPVLYVGAAGGFGATGVHTTTLLGSTDVESLINSVVPPEAVLIDWGHADLFRAADAPAQVFQPLLDRLLAH